MIIIIIIIIIMQKLLSVHASGSYRIGIIIIKGESFGARPISDEITLLRAIIGVVAHIIIITLLYYRWRRRGKKNGPLGRFIRSAAALSGLCVRSTWNNCNHE